MRTRGSSSWSMWGARQRTLGAREQRQWRCMGCKGRGRQCGVMLLVREGEVRCSSSKRQWRKRMRKRRKMKARRQGGMMTTKRSTRTGIYETQGMRKTLVGMRRMAVKEAWLREIVQKVKGRGRATMMKRMRREEKGRRKRVRKKPAGLMTGEAGKIVSVLLTRVVGRKKAAGPRSTAMWMRGKRKRVRMGRIYTRMMGALVLRKKKARTSMTMILRRQTLRRHGRAMAAASRGPGPRGVQGCTHSTGLLHPPSVAGKCACSTCAVPPSSSVLRAWISLEKRRSWSCTTCLAVIKSTNQA
mmetsp:Transcript_21353/g.55588  ORF Transcript_21353/g.55588 Transcript_21353/m.55588 type:complete len:300 (-) Transcript_21353:487-1386(-)